MDERKQNFDRQTDRQTDRGIQVLRIIACIAVFICHFGQVIELDKRNGLLYDLTQLGSYGVELFFVISGYLVCYLLSKEKSVFAFYKKRLIRILPLYYFCILYFFVTETFMFHSVPADPYHLGWLRYIFCLNGIVPSSDIFWSNLGITWTIPVFLLFYLLSPLIMKLAKSTLSSTVLLIMAAGLALFIKCMIPGWLSALYYLPCFILGIIVYYARKENRRFVVVLCLLTLVIVTKWVCLGDEIKILSQDAFIVSSLCAVMVIVTDCFTIQSNTAKKVLDVLDEHSYTLYLVHGIVFNGILWKFGFNGFYLPVLDVYIKSAIIKALVAIVSTGVLTYLIHRWIEKPIQKQLTKLLL